MNDETRPDLPAVLSAVAIRSYMRATGWTEGMQGSHGSVFTRGGFKVSVPLEDDDPDLIRMAIYRLAVAEKREPGETEAAVRSYRDARGSVAPVGVPASDDSGRDSPGAPDGSRERTGAVSQAHPLDAALEAVAVMEEAEVTWSLAAGGDRYRRALILSTALRAAGPAIVTEANLTAEARLAEVRQTIAAFLAHHGNSAAFALQSARDLAEGIRQVLDREALETPESGKTQDRTDEKEAAQP